MKMILKILPLVAMVTFMSCEKEKEADVNSITEDEAVDMVALALAENSAGATSVVETATTTTDKVVNDEPLTNESDLTLKSTATSACGFSHDTTFSVQNKSGMVITFDYSFSYNYSLACNQFNIPESMTASYSYNGNFNAPRLESTNDGTGSLTISGLELSTNTYTVEGTFKQDGSFQSKVRNQNSSNSNIEIELIDLSINKGTYEIEGGTASAVIEGSIPQKGSFKYQCSIIFNGDGTATVTINEDVYLIDLEDGEIIE